VSYVSTSLRWRGKVAEAVNQAHQRRHADQDVTGTFPCPHCGSPLRFTTMMNGLTRGQCVSTGCIRWVQ
jgi:hypothetical protein